MVAPMVKVGVEEFLVACRVDGLSGQTVNWYRSMLEPLAVRLDGLQVDAVSVHSMRQYILDLRDQTSRYQGASNRTHEESGGLSDESMRGRIRAFKRFFNWCCAEYEIEVSKNPMTRIRMPQRANSEPKAIALDDLRRLLEATDETIWGKRDRALIVFLADTGCRAAGALTLKLPSLYLDQGRAIVNEKGDRTRAVPFTRFTAHIIKEWLEVRPVDATTVFCAVRSPHAPLTVNGLNQVIERLKIKSGVTGRCNPHSFRHGFARAYLENGGDLATLARLMGHSNVSVTASFYAVFTDGELARRHEMFSPLKNLGGKREE